MDNRLFVPYYQWSPESLLGGDKTPALHLVPNKSLVTTGGSRQFTAANVEYLSHADDADLDLGTGDISFQVSFYRDSTGQQGLISKREGDQDYWMLEVNSDDVLHFIAVVAGVTVIEITGNTELTTGVWYNAACVLDRDSAAGSSIYLNGVIDGGGATTMDATNIDNSWNMYIGSSGEDFLLAEDGDRLLDEDGNYLMEN